MPTQKSRGTQRQPVLFKTPRKKRKPPRRVTGIQLIKNAERTAFDIANAAREWPTLDSEHRAAVHQAHIFINAVRTRTADPKQAMDLLEATRKLVKAVRALEKDKRTGQQRLGI